MEGSSSLVSGFSEERLPEECSFLWGDELVWEGDVKMLRRTLKTSLSMWGLSNVSNKGKRKREECLRYLLSFKKKNVMVGATYVDGRTYAKLSEVAKIFFLFF